MSTIIGFSYSVHDAGVTLIQDGVIKAAYSEERFSNHKMKGGTVDKSLTALIKDYNLNLDTVDHFVTSTSIGLNDKNDIVTKKYADRIQFYPHQYCHGLGALVFSGFHDKNDVMVLTLDGGDFNIHNLIHGEYIDKKVFDWLHNTIDQHWWCKFKNSHNACEGSISIYKDGNLHVVKDFNANFGRLYFFGATMMVYYYKIGGTNMEGKIMGLAAQGKFNEHIYRTFRNMCVFNKETETFENHLPNECKTGNWENGRILDSILTFLCEYSKEDVAYNLQKCVEDGCIELIQFYQEKYNCKYICVSGGFFANVKVNQKINEELNFEEIFVMPAMNDEGISCGAALAKSIELGEYKFEPIKDVYLGKGYDENTIRRFVKVRFVNYHPFTYEHIIDELKNGKVVGVFRGRTEFGPRSLGNRSILVDPTNKETFYKLNQKLSRNDIMPFAPVILEEHVDNILDCNKSKHTAEFMTICYNVKQEWVNKIPAVINQYDNTCRPQILRQEVNPWLHILLSKYNEQTGIPLLLNTSFNVHCCPIINTPLQAWEMLRDRYIDVLVLEDYIIYYDHRK